MDVDVDMDVDDVSGLEEMKDQDGKDASESVYNFDKSLTSG